MIEMLGMDTPPAPRADTGAGPLLEEAACLFAAAVVLVTVAVFVEVADLVRLVEDYEERRA